MPTRINIEAMMMRWQEKYQKRITVEEIAERAGISIIVLYRMKSGEMEAADLRKINAICKVLECEPGEIIVRENTDIPPISEVQNQLQTFRENMTIKWVLNDDDWK